VIFYKKASALRMVRLGRPISTIPPNIGWGAAFCWRFLGLSRTYGGWRIFYYKSCS